jgi:hypothetical protein
MATRHRDGPTKPESDTATLAGATPDRGRYLLEATALLAAVIFLTGWEYGHAYYSVFGVGLTQLEVDVPHFFVWARRPLLERWYVTLPIVVVALLVLPGYPDIRGWLRHSEFQRWLPKMNNPSLFLLVGVVLLFVLLPPLAGMVGEHDGMRDLFDDTTTLAPVSITLKEPDQPLRAHQRRAGILGGQYYLLGHHKTAYYLVPPRRQNSISITPPRVLVLPDELVAAVRILEPEPRHE